jgi:hypothetical protein
MAEKTDTKKDIELTPAQAIVEGIKQGMAELAKVIKPQDALDMAGLSEARKAQLREPPKPKKCRDFAVRFPQTGATAIAHVVESAKLKNGRIVSFSDYRHPRAAYIAESEGGLVPNGFPIWAAAQPMNLPEDEEPALGHLNQAFKQWRYENFWQRDLRDFVGVEIQPHICQEPDALRTTPWQEGRIAAPAEAA